MKYFIFALFTFYQNVTFSQTYIGPLLGIDFMQLETKGQPEANTIYTIENGYKNVSLFGGLVLNQIVNKHLFISIKSDYSTKTVKAATFGVIPLDNIRFNYWRNGIRANYWNNSYFFGVGFNLNYLKNVRKLYVDQESDPFVSNLLDYGIEVGSGLIYKRFEFGLYYYLALNSIQDPSENLNVKPISSIGIRMNYNFKIFEKLGSSGVECPDF